MTSDAAVFTYLDDDMGRVCREGDEIVIVAGDARLRAPRGLLIACEPMLGRFYRTHHSPPFPVEHGEDIVVVLRVDGEPTRSLGPFPHRWGLALARAIERARRETLVAVPGFVVTVARDEAGLVFDLGSQVTVPLPVGALVAARVAESQPVGRHVLPTGSADAHLYVELVFAGSSSWAVGPLPDAIAEQLVAAFTAWRSAHPLDETPVDIGMAELAATPARWHRRKIRVEGWWRSWFERSSFGPVWLSGGEPPAGDGDYRVRVVGTLTYPDATSTRGYGHLGGYPGELEAESVEILEARPVSPAGAQDGLTDLLTKGAWLSRFEAALSAGPVCVAFLDVDRFKRVNDTHGHRVGDDLLRTWAALVVSVVGDRGIVGRWGSDEIVVLFVRPIELDLGARLVDEVLSQVRSQIRVAGTPGAVTCSAGLAMGGAGERPRDVLARADEALHEAKRAGMDRARCHRPRGD